MDWNFKDLDFKEELNQGKELPEFAQTLMEIALEDIEQMETEQKAELAHSYLMIALLYLDRQDFDQSLAFFIKSKDLLEELILEVDTPEIEHDLAQSYFQLATGYERLHDLEKTKDYYLKSVEALKAALESRSSREFEFFLAGCYNNLSLIFTQEEDYAKALSYIEKAISLHKELEERFDNPESKMSLAQGYFNKACILLRLDRFEQAIDAAERSLEIQTSLIHEPGIRELFHSLAHSYNLAAEICWKDDQKEKSLDYQLKALEIWKDLFEEEDLLETEISLANTLNDAAMLFYQLHDISQALKLFKNHVELMENIEKKEPDFFSLERAAASYRILADLYNFVGDKEKTLASLDRAIALNEALLQQDFHPGPVQEILDCCNFAGDLSKSQGEYEKAALYHQKAVDLQEKLMKMASVDQQESFEELEDHQLLSLAPNLFSLAENYDILEDDYFRAYDYTTALHLAEKTVGVIERLSRQYDHPDNLKALIAGYNNLAMAYRKSAQKQKSLAYLDKARALFEQVVEQNGLESGDEEVFMILYTNTGKIYHDLGDLDQAQNYYEKALELRTRYESDLEDPYYKKASAVLQSHIARAFFDKKDYPEALVTLHHACASIFDIAKQYNVPQDWKELAGYLNNLSMIYDALGDSEKALEALLHAIQIWGNLSESFNVPELSLALSTGLNNASDYYRKLKDYETAWKYGQDALMELKKLEAHFNEPELKEHLAELYTSLGNICFETEQFDKALDYYGQAYQLSKELRDQEPLPQYFYDLAVLNFNLYKVFDQQQKPEQAIACLEESIRLLEKLRNLHSAYFQPAFAAVRAEKLAELFEEKNETEKAGYYRELAREIREENTDK